MFDLTLTFDNGPEPEVTSFVLDLLRRRGIRSTFFAIGEKAARPGSLDLLRRAHGEGHWIGNHTWTHRVPLGERGAPGAAEEEVARTQRLLGPLAQPARLFRPFGGGGNLDRRLLNTEVFDHLVAGGYTCVLWNAVPRDWADADGWVDTALAQCALRPWTLMVLHDLPGGAMRHLERFLDEVTARDGHIRQDFPPDCVPMMRGQVVMPMESYVTRALPANNEHRFSLDDRYGGPEPSAAQHNARLRERGTP